MRKACLLVIALVALVFAGENWIGYTPQAVSAPTNNAEPIPQVLPPAGTDLPNADTIKYDDNTAASAWALTHAGGGFGVKFVKPANPINLAGAMVNLWANTWPTPGGNRFMVKVFAANGLGGAPGDSLFQSDVITGTRGAWNYVPIAIPIIDYDFYIFYIQPDTYPACPGMSIDAAWNTPDNTQWELADGAFSLAPQYGDWLIRAVLDWTPQTNNVAAMYFNKVPRETIPGVNLPLQATFRNFGTQTQNAGVRVKMQITGPEGYVRDFVNDSTTGAMAYRGQQIVTFHPNWRVPDTVGPYTIKVWHELPSDEYRANDTMVRTISAAKWYTYANWASPYIYVVWAGPQRATMFHPPDFQLNYPVQINRVRGHFWVHPSYPWDDSIFHFAIYSENGDSLWASDTIRAAHNVSREAQVTPPVNITSGDFYVAVIPRSINGYPSSVSDTHPQAVVHSWVGDPNSGWNPWTNGEFWISVSARTNISALGEGRTVSSDASVMVSALPNPGSSPLIGWQILHATPVRITLYDILGREVRILNVNRHAQALSGSFRLDTKGLASGLYVLKLKSGTARATAKLAVN